MLKAISAVISFSALSSFALHAAESDVIALKQQLKAIPAFSANFTQQVKSPEGDVLQDASGNMALVRPNKLRWNTQFPDEQLIVSDGDAVWLYNPFLEQVSIYSLEAAIEQTPFMLLTTNNEQLWEKYEVETVTNGYRISPMKARSVAWIELSFAKQTQIDTLRIADMQGNISHIQLSQWQNKPLEASQFHFSPPDGTDIDDQR